MKLVFHHINYVSKNVDQLNDFYKNIMKMDSISEDKFSRTQTTENKGYDGDIKFVTEGSMQMHLAEIDYNIAANNEKHINPVEKGHIAFRTDNLKEFKTLLTENKIPFADYGTTFSTEWDQIFFYDPDGNIIEVHQEIK